jgi:hypothetical protein
MPDRLTCPVCERPGVSPDSKKCPQCDADLTCFHALETLAEHKGGAAESAVAAQKAGNEGGGGSRRAVLLLILLLVLLAASFFFFSLKAKNRVHDLNQQVVALQTDLRRTRQNSELPKQVLCVLPDSEQVGSVEEESFAEDDPLIYEEDREDKEKHGSSAPSAAMEKGKDAEKDAKDTQAAEVMVGTAGSAGSAGRNKAETVPMVFVEAMLKKKEPEKKEFARPSENAAAKAKAEAEAEAEEPWAEPSPLLPEEKWSEKTFLYLIKESDTLWDLAEHFYGDGKYYPVIMEQNPGLVISNIHDEEILRLFNERTVLEDIYTRRIEWRDGLVLWKHKVRAGETRKSIENRFASPGAAGSVFYEKTPNIHPGATVRIILH